VMTSRDIALAEATGGKYHLMHVSTAGSVDIVRRAKRRDVRGTTEVTPHHFTLTDECLRSFDSNFKMSPPLRGKEHVEAILAGLADGTIAVIASDHAPHAKEKKMQELDQAPFGIVGLETSLGLVITKLIEPGHLDWPTALAKLTVNPARILGIRAGLGALGWFGRGRGRRWLALAGARKAGPGRIRELRPLVRKAGLILPPLPQETARAWLGRMASLRPQRAAQLASLARETDAATYGRRPGTALKAMAREEARHW